MTEQEQAQEDQFRNFVPREVERAASYKEATQEEATRYVVCRNVDQGPGQSTIIWLAPGSVVVVVDDLATAKRFADQLREDGDNR